MITLNFHSLWFPIVMTFVLCIFQVIGLIIYRNSMASLAFASWLVVGLLGSLVVWIGWWLFL